MRKQINGLPLAGSSLATFAAQVPRRTPCGTQGRIDITCPFRQATLLRAAY